VTPERFHRITSGVTDPGYRRKRGAAARRDPLKRVTTNWTHTRLSAGVIISDWEIFTGKSCKFRPFLATVARLSEPRK
jgi:hypothetical protein